MVQCVTSLGVRPFLPRDVLSLGVDDATAEAISALASTGAWTMVGPEGPLIVGGIQRYWEGVGQGWLYLSASRVCEAGIVGVVRLLRTTIARVQRDGGYWRVEAYVLAETPEAQRFARILGLSYEGDKPLFGQHGEDYQCYALLDAEACPWL